MSTNVLQFDSAHRISKANKLQFRRSGLVFQSFNHNLGNRVRKNMALSFWNASLALAIRQAGLSVSELLMLGRQANVLTRREIEYLSHAYEYELDSNRLSVEPWAEPFFEALGVTAIESLDYSDYEGARYVHDMNAPWHAGLPPRQFDTVFDGGTLEHVFNYPQALINSMSLVKPGGCLVSVTPVDGWLGHGFYQPQPELFFRFLTAERGFCLRGVWLAEHGRAPGKSRLFQIIDPALSGCRPLITCRRPLSMLVVAEKISEISGSFSWPSQSNYTAMWGGRPSEDMRPSKSRIDVSVKRIVFRSLPEAIQDPVRRYLIKRRHLRDARAGWEEVAKLEIPESGTSLS